MAVANGTIDALGVADMCRSLQGGGVKLLDADFLAEVSVSCNMSKQDLRKFRAIARERLGANACASEHDEKAARTTHRKDFGLETHFFDDPTIGVDGAYIDVVAAIEKLIETRDPNGVHTPDVVHICFSNDGTDHGKAVPHSLQGATFRCWTGCRGLAARTTRSCGCSLAPSSRRRAWRPSCKNSRSFSIA